MPLKTLTMPAPVANYLDELPSRGSLAMEQRKTPMSFLGILKKAWNYDPYEDKPVKDTAGVPEVKPTIAPAAPASPDNGSAGSGSGGAANSGGADGTPGDRGGGPASEAGEKAGEQEQGKDA